MGEEVQPTRLLQQQQCKSPLRRPPLAPGRRGAGTKAAGVVVKTTTQTRRPPATSIMTTTTTSSTSRIFDCSMGSVSSSSSTSTNSVPASSPEDEEVLGLRRCRSSSSRSSSGSIGISSSSSVKSSCCYEDDEARVTRKILGDSAATAASAAASRRRRRRPTSSSSLVQAPPGVVQPQQQQPHDDCGALLRPQRRCPSFSMMSISSSSSAATGVATPAMIPHSLVRTIENDFDNLIQGTPFLRDAIVSSSAASAADNNNSSASGGGGGNGNLLDNVGLFHRSEICLGRRIGRGGFSDVYEIQSFHLDSNVCHRLTESQRSTRKYYAKNATAIDTCGTNMQQQQQQPAPRYVIKFLQKRLLLNQQQQHHHHQQKNGGRLSPITGSLPLSSSSPGAPPSFASSSTATAGAVAAAAVSSSLPSSLSSCSSSSVAFRQAAVDLAMEAAYMSVLDHPYILKLRGLPVNGIQSWYDVDAAHDSYFIITDRLDTTLDYKIHQEWKKTTTTSNNETNDMKGQEQEKDDNDDILVATKTSYAIQLADALKYLHERRLVYRDLKPANIGIRGDNGSIQLFDFGLCRQLPSIINDDGIDCVVDDLLLYEMSGVGTRRYMAPEVILGGGGGHDGARRYNCKADVYSYGLVVWEMFNLSKPYQDCRNYHDHRILVCGKGERPPINMMLPTTIQIALCRSWTCVEERASMNEIYRLLPTMVPCSNCPAQPSLSLLTVDDDNVDSSAANHENIVSTVDGDNNETDCGGIAMTTTTAVAGTILEMCCITAAVASIYGYDDDYDNDNDDHCKPSQLPQNKQQLALLPGLEAVSDDSNSSLSLDNSDDDNEQGSGCIFDMSTTMTNNNNNNSWTASPRLKCKQEQEKQQYNTSSPAATLSSSSSSCLLGLDYILDRSIFSMQQ